MALPYTLIHTDTFKDAYSRDYSGCTLQYNRYT